MKKVLYLALLAGFGLTSCKKSDTTGGTGDNSNNPAPSIDKFMSFTAGSTWNYNEHDNTNNGDTSFTRTCTDELVILESNQYYIFLDSNHIVNNIDSSFFNVVGNEYFQFTTLSSQLPGFKEKYLVDNASTSTSWIMPYSATIGTGTMGANITANIVNTIEEKGSSLTVNNVNYSNVYKVKTEILNATVSLPTIGSLPTTISQNIHSYYAPKYGLIKNDRQLNISVTISPTLALILSSTLGLTIPAGDIPIINTNKTTTLTSKNF
jgi:hypothetical protein